MTDPEEPVMDDRLREALELIEEMAPAYHATESVRNHADPNDLTGWHVKGIETCADALCVEAVRLTSFRAAIEGVPIAIENEDSPDPLRAYNEGFAAGQLSVVLDEERLARAIRTAEVRSQMRAEQAGAVPAEDGPLPDWYRAYAADVAREYINGGPARAAIEGVSRDH